MDFADFMAHMARGSVRQDAFARYGQSVYSSIDVVFEHISAICKDVVLVFDAECNSANITEFETALAAQRTAWLEANEDVNPKVIPVRPKVLGYRHMDLKFADADRISKALVHYINNNDSIDSISLEHQVGYLLMSMNIKGDADPRDIAAELDKNGSEKGARFLIINTDTKDYLVHETGLEF